jgi:hypothetical protein
LLGYLWHQQPAAPRPPAAVEAGKPGEPLKLRLERQLGR